MLSSDPHAWLRPYYAALRSHPAFLQFAPATQFEALVKAVEREHASKAAQMRQWTVPAQHALLTHLASMLDQKETAAPFELWHVRKGERQLRCVAVYLPTGIDLRLLEGDTAFDGRNSARMRRKHTRYLISGAWRCWKWAGRHNTPVSSPVSVVESYITA